LTEKINRRVAIYRCNLAQEYYLQVQELFNVVREEGSSNVPIICKMLMAMFSPEHRQWRTLRDTYGYVPMERYHSEACEYLDALNLMWEEVDPVKKDSPHEA
jgi:hypothetical protein